MAEDSTKKIYQVIQSALFIPSWRSLNPLKGSLNHHKKVTLNHQVPGDGKMRDQTSSPFSLGWSRFFNHFKFGSLKFTGFPKKGHQHFRTQNCQVHRPLGIPGSAPCSERVSKLLGIATCSHQILSLRPSRRSFAGPKQQGNHLVKTNETTAKSDSA